MIQSTTVKIFDNCLHKDNCLQNITTMTTTNVRSIYKQNNIVPSLIKRVDDILNPNDGTHPHIDLSKTRKSCLSRASSPNLFYKIHAVRDILGSLWIRPFTPMSDREPFEMLCSELVHLKIVTKQKLKTLIDTEMKTNVNHNLDIAIENVLLKLLVDTLQKLLLHALNTCLY